MNESDNIASLTESADGLRDEVVKLRQALSKFAPRVRRAEIISVVCVLLVLTGVVVFNIYRQLDTDNRIAGLCPVLALVLGGADPESRPPGEARERYKESIRVITQAYGQLGCQDPLVPPRTDPAPPTTGG